MKELAVIVFVWLMFSLMVMALVGSIIPTNLTIFNKNIELKKDIKTWLIVIFAAPLLFLILMVYMLVVSVRR